MALLSRLISCAVAVSAAAAKFPSVLLSKEWHYLGPFQIGKTELDSEPISFKDALPAVGTRHKFASELATGGYVSWGKLTADANGGIQISPSSVDWNSLVRTTNRMEVLEHQGWAFTTFSLPGGSPLRVKAACRGVTTYYLQAVNNASSAVTGDNLYPAALLHQAGDIYHSGRIASYLTLEPGAYRLVVRVRAKVQSSFQCEVSAVDGKAAAKQPLLV